MIEEKRLKEKDERFKKKIKREQRKDYEFMQKTIVHRIRDIVLY